MGPEVYAPAPRGASQRLQIVLERLADLGMLPSIRDSRLQVAELGAAVVTRSLETVGEHAVFSEQLRDRVGELDLAARARFRIGEVMKNARREDVAPDHPQRRGGGLGFGLLDDPHDALEKPKPEAAPSTLGVVRSEEHTSELQSLTNLVCRLL